MSCRKQELKGKLISPPFLFPPVNSGRKAHQFSPSVCDDDEKVTQYGKLHCFAAVWDSSINYRGLIDRRSTTKTIEGRRKNNLRMRRRRRHRNCNPCAYDWGAGRENNAFYMCVCVRGCTWREEERERKKERDTGFVICGKEMFFFDE